MGQVGRPTAQIVLSDDERETLERWARRPKTGQALALRCRIVLAAATGITNQQIARELSCNAVTVGKWRTRFAEKRWTGCSMSLDRVSRARSPTTSSRR